MMALPGNFCLYRGRNGYEALPGKFCMVIELRLFSGTDLGGVRCKGDDDVYWH